MPDKIQLGDRVRTYAWIAGVLFLLGVVGGSIGEFYVPSQIIVPGDAAATAHNVLASDLIFRLGFLAYLLEAFTDVALTFLLYVLLRPVHANLAFLTVLFRLVATITFAFAELFYFAPSLILGGDGYLNSFSTAPLQSVALLSFNMYGAAGYLFLPFYGIGSIILGYLMWRSGYLPRFLGALWVIGGVGFVTRSVVYVLAPAYPASLLQVPTILALLSLGVWLLVKGVDVVKWKEREGVAT